jgi:hypothetical protein
MQKQTMPISNYGMNMQQQLAQQQQQHNTDPYLMNDVNKPPPPPPQHILYSQNQIPPQIQPQTQPQQPQFMQPQATPPIQPLVQYNNNTMRQASFNSTTTMNTDPNLINQTQINNNFNVSQQQQQSSVVEFVNDDDFELSDDLLTAPIIPTNPVTSTTNVPDMFYPTQPQQHQHQQQQQSIITDFSYHHQQNQQYHQYENQNTKHSFYSDQQSNYMSGAVDLAADDCRNSSLLQHLLLE